MSELDYQLDLLKAMNQKLTEKERMYQAVCESADGAFLYISLDKTRICTLGQWRDFFDFDVRDGADVQRILEEVEEADFPKLQRALYLEKDGNETDTADCQLKSRRIWARFCVRVFYDGDRKPVDKVVHITNITKQRYKDDELLYMAYYDNLTGLYNRNYFVRLLGEYIRNAEDSNSIVSVMNIDIDEFNKVNDGMGIIMGDELVQQFGLFLKELCQQENMIACHLHRDVFCIAIYDPAGRRTAAHIYSAIRDRLKEPFRLSNGFDISITVSVGVAEYPEASRSALELINYAELVVFRVKSAGRNGIQYFDAPILKDYMGSVELENRLKEAVANKDFVLYYQPQYYTGNRRLRGVEALVRWRDPDGGLISPDTFIPVAEKNGSIVTIGKWVVEESIRQYAEWRKQFGFPFIMSINISALQYKKENFVDFLLGVLDDYQVKPSEVELEITESVLIDDFGAVTEKLKVLRGYGIRISLDDFGTGFSSLSYLKKLPIDTLKIDKSFIDTVMTDASTRVITESILNMVKALGFESIAEGVEEEQQYKYLHAIGCDVIQGYLFGRPLPPKDLEKVFAGRRKEPADE